ncbi:YceD family protein [Devosia nitrariae]|uniref:Metal-binding protein n=1 Tax=Devosia nitrariae TaxID=2071872 RepID=A0ABQ5W8L1_9HYPH|nr:DUF177 domain-containing protein [Devosia nitrariae]GLQ56295.1 metal-binding protein [Devosia nitrariae]
MSRPLSPLLPDAVLRIDQIPPAGRTLSVKANDEALARLTERLKISALERLTAEIKISRFRGGLRAAGRIEATVVQPCVVTAERVTQEIDEPVDRVFLPTSQRARGSEPGSETFVDLEGEDPPDYFDGPELDLTELLVETLALAIDPYPRAPGASLESLELDPDDAETSPFARLKGLKPRSGDE